LMLMLYRLMVCDWRGQKRCISRNEKHVHDARKGAFSVKRRMG
jgi:hypothetical protein